MRSFRPGASLAAALLVGLLLRLAYASYVQRRHFLPTEMEGYETIALSMLERGEYAMTPGQPTSMREPGFPLFIAAVYKAVGGRRPWALLGLQCLLSAVTAWMSYRLARRLFGERAGLAAAWVYSLYPQAVYYSGYYFRETFSALLVTGLVCASALWREEGPAGDRAALGGGAAAAAAGLTNSALMPAALLCGLALLSSSSGKRLRRLTLYFLPVLAATAAWTARNYSVQGRLVLGSTHGGEEFYQALIVPPGELGTPRQSEIVNADAQLQAVSLAPEGARNAALIKASLGWIKDHPGVYASRAVAGVVKFWRLWPYQRRYDHSYWTLILASALSDVWLVPLGLAGLWFFRRRFWEAPAAWISVGATTLLYGMVHAVIRYRMPLMATVCALAAGLALGREKRA